MHQRFWVDVPYDEFWPVAGESLAEYVAQHEDAGPAELGYVLLGRVWLPPIFIARFEDADEGGPDISLRFEIRDGVPECRQLQVTATETGHEVRYSGIVGVRVEDILESAIRELTRGRVAGTPGPPPGLDRETIDASRTGRRQRRVTITDSLLQETAEVYRAAPRKPTMAVAEHFDVAHRTAALYVQRAREAGHLPATSRGKAKA